MNYRWLSLMIELSGIYAITLALLWPVLRLL